MCMCVCRVAYCEGKFPEFMLDAWDEYDYRKDSDNDRPGRGSIVSHSISRGD